MFPFWQFTQQSTVKIDQKHPANFGDGNTSPSTRNSKSGISFQGYILTDKGPLSVYLGIQVDRLQGNKISMKQPALIERIIAQCGLKDMRMHDTPADTILDRDENGQERKNDFHYHSLVGELNYLAATTRPDIQFAVH